MKKFGILIFIVALIVGVVFSNLFSFGKASERIFNISFSKSVQGSGVSGTETRDIGAFSGLDVGGVFNVEVTAGREFGIEVAADENLLQYIRTEVQNGVLRISATERLKSHTPIRVRVSAPELESIGASGACQVWVTGVDSTDLRLDTSGASKVNVSGEAASLIVDISGASSIEAEGLKAKEASVRASGASRVNVSVAEKLTAKASGASKIRYTGNPLTVEKNTSGASKIYQE